MDCGLKGLITDGFTCLGSLVLTPSKPGSWCLSSKQTASLLIVGCVLALSLAVMRAVLSVFENYQKARVNFVQTVAELATRPQNIEALQNAGVMQLLRPLLLDNVPSIQQSSALALGRLANYNDELAEAVVSNEVLPQLVYSLSEQNRFYKKAAAFVLRAVAKHSPQLAQVCACAPACLRPCARAPGRRLEGGWSLTPRPGQRAASREPGLLASHRARKAEALTWN